MPVVKWPFISRKMVQEHSTHLFVFGDNLAQAGYGGQAKEMRGEPNSVGIPTKKAPSMEESAFFSDADYLTYVRTRFEALTRLKAHLDKGGTVVIPKAGLGTERAELEKRSPKIWKQLQDDLASLEHGRR